MLDEQTVSPKLLRQFVPLDGLKRESLAALAQKITLRSLAAGEVLFKQGTVDRRILWLLSGRLEILQPGQPPRTVSGGTQGAVDPICPGNPRPATVRALDSVQFLSIDSELLDVAITWDQTGIYEVAELKQEDDTGGGGDDWMTTLLTTKAFHRIPPANLQAIFQRLERVPYRAGETVIRQGADGDYFYVIVSGRCVVTRESPLNRTGLKLAELSTGDTFGEEALLSAAKRNATVSMLTDGVLMRLGVEDFRELMSEPLLQRISYERAAEIVAHGGQWLDVRMPREYQTHAIASSLNVPLCFIRPKLGMLDRKVPYVVLCDTERRSCAAAFILVELGFEAYVLAGGLNQNPQALRRSA
ncbi:MAG: cyclic nucleotide-binding domain-containing protein [Pseudomonadota bacterium]|jgi:CRP-like cAMP-binding protein|nr:cyclic nucleotide-binding domain-containing protein [Pseudomonadota bacterium]